jgi:hypothetical protein
MQERPLWLELLFRSGLARGCFESRFAPYRQDAVKRDVQERTSAEPGRVEELRAAALNELANADWRIVERALAYLLVVGQASDAAAIEFLTEHPEEYIRKGAQACLFEVRRRQGGA